MCVTVIPVGLLRNYTKAPSPILLPCAGATIEELLKQLGIPSELVAIALVNGLQRPKSYPLAEGDVVKLVPLMGGG
jgi:sulfur carrier protein ThiS